MTTDDKSKMIRIKGVQCLLRALLGLRVGLLLVNFSWALVDVIGQADGMLA